jgi:hypothetical protein
MSKKVIQFNEGCADELMSHTGKYVNVCITSIPLVRNGFHTSMCILGELEGGEAGFRVRDKSGDSYAYFQATDVYAIVNPVKIEGRQFKDGTEVSIYVQWQGGE